MTQLIIDTTDAPAILRAARNMINELLGGGPQAVAVETIESAERTHTHFEGTEIKHTPENTNTGPSSDSDMPADTTAASDTRVDANQVRFDPDFCGNAAKPFYGSGKRSGQWKKRQGVDEAAYDAWYAAQTALVTASTPAEEDAPINTAGAFGGDSGNQPASDPAPEDCGAFMGWVSAKQAGGLLSQTDIGEAYTQAGVQVTDLFPPNPENIVKQNVAVLYQILVVKAGA